MPEMIPAVDHAHAAHGHGSGIPWLDLIVGLSAIFISVVSLVVSIEHGKTMEKMVDQNQKLVVASTLPLLTYDWNTIDPATGKPMVRLNLHNNGVGPAIIEQFELRYKGTAYTPETGLLRACCEQALGKNGYHPYGFGNISGGILPARETAYLLNIKPTSSKDKLIPAFEEAKKDMSFHACYCSVLEECWETDFDQKRPKPVKECKVTAQDKLW